MKAAEFFRSSKALLYSANTPRMGAWLEVARALIRTTDGELKSELFFAAPDEMQDVNFDHVGAVVCGDVEQHKDILSLTGQHNLKLVKSEVVARELGYSATVLRTRERLEVIVAEPVAAEAVSNFGSLGGGAHIAFSVPTEERFVRIQSYLEKIGWFKRISWVNRIENVRIAYYDRPLGRVEIIWRRP